MKNEFIKEQLNKYDIRNLSDLYTFVFTLLNPKTCKVIHRPDFIFDMETFGKVNNNICYGCMATATIIEMCGIDNILDYPAIRKIEFKNCLDNYEPINIMVFTFEGLIDSIRLNNFYTTLTYLTQLLSDGVWPNFFPEIHQKSFRDEFEHYMYKEYLNPINNEVDFYNFYQSGMHLNIIDSVRIFELKKGIL